MGVVQRRTVSEDADAVRYDRQTERRWALDASDVIALLAGLLFLVMGLLALGSRRDARDRPRAQSMPTMRRRA